LTVRSPPSSFNQSNRAHDSPEEFIERPISGEDISGINEDDDNDDDAQQHNSQWNGTIGRDELPLPLLPSHLTIPAQQHHPMIVSEGRGNDTTTNTSNSGRLIMDDESGRNHSTAHRSTKVENSQINSTAAEGNNSISGHRTKRGMCDSRIPLNMHRIRFYHYCGKTLDYQQLKGGNMQKIEKHLI
jgi:hypothetical protein